MVVLPVPVPVCALEWKSWALAVVELEAFGEELEVELARSALKVARMVLDFIP